MAPAKETAPATLSIEERLEKIEADNAALRARNAELEATVPAPTMQVFRTQSGAEQSIAASVSTPDRAKATKLLNEGCPACQEPIRMYDFPIAMPSIPGLWPALVFHYRTKHMSKAGVLQHPMPDPPDPLDEKAMDTLITIVDDGSWGVGLGKKLSIPYRQLLDRAITAWHAGER